MPEVDMRHVHPPHPSRDPPRRWAGRWASAAGGRRARPRPGTRAGATDHGGVGDETRLMTRTTPLARSRETPRPCSAGSTGWSGATCPTSRRRRGRSPCPGRRRSCRTAWRGPSKRRSRASASAWRAGTERGEVADHGAGAAGGAVPAQAGAQEGRGHARGARHDRDRGAAVPEHPDRRPHPGRGARVVCAAADAGAARGGHRARLLRHPRPPGAPPDRPHGRLRDGLRQRRRQRGSARRWRRRSSASCRWSRPTPTPAGASSRPCSPSSRSSSSTTSATRTRPRGAASRWRSRSSSARRWPSSTRSSCGACSTRCRCRRACASSCSTSGPTCWPPPRCATAPRASTRGA